MINKKLKCVAVLVLAVIMLFGCSGADSPQGADLIKYAAAPFEAGVSGTVDGVTFEALLTADEPSAVGERDVCLEFFSPETLSGVTVRRRDGVVSYVCGGQSFEFEGGGRGWLDIADLLCAEGQVTGVERVENSGRVRVRMVSGEQALMLTVDAETGYPCEAQMISPREISLEVMSFRQGERYQE